MHKQVKVIIPFRLREGADMRRAANLEVVHAWWYSHGYEVQVVSDGLDGDAQFNRHRAYNRAIAANPEGALFIFTEADMLVHPAQINEAIAYAMHKPGLVVPFTQYRYLSDLMTEAVRDDYNDLSPEEISDWWGRDVDQEGSIFGLDPESTMEDGASIGAINVMSRKTLDMTGGFTEATSGNWYDDNIIAEGFAYLTGTKTRYVEGPAVHLYHLPGHVGDHLSDEDRAATAHNRNLLIRMRTDIRMRRTSAVRELMAVRS